MLENWIFHRNELIESFIDIAKAHELYLDGCSIAEMAERVATDGGINVEYDIQDEKENGFPKTLHMDLDTSALRKLGWKPAGRYPINEMFKRMIQGFRTMVDC